MSAHSGEERLGPYRLREQLGEGGMGVVYLARDASDEPVAVKVLRQGVPAEATARRRLAREVDVMRRVQSPFVAEVIDADVECSPPYIVTRYVSGRTLDELVAAEGPITGQALATLARGLAAALVAVHSAGVVHRDLKPGNVMLVDGQPVVIDFGIAQTPESTRLTMTGMFMGTPGYLAPEVIEGKPSGPAADVHSWAATIAYAATGRPPFGTGQFEAIFYKIVHGQPELDTMPRPLLPIVLAALARDPSRRPSAADLAELTAALDETALVRSPTGAVAGAVAQAAVDLSNEITHTALDMPGAVAGHAAAAAGPGAAIGGAKASAAPGAGPAFKLPAPAAPPPPAPRWPSTRPMAVQPKDSFADMLPPVRYDQSAAFGLAPATPGVPGQVVPAQFAPPSRARPPAANTGPGGGPLATGQRPGGAAQSLPVTRLLILMTLVGLIAVSILLPIAGAAGALAVVVLLRAGDGTARWLDGRRGRAGPRPSDGISTALFYPLALCRSAFACLLLAPVALLFAAAAAVLAVLALGPDHLTRVAGYTAGGLIAGYCFGPGSSPCRRSLGRFYGRGTRFVPAAFLGVIGVAGIAVAVIAAAKTQAPGFWPAAHLGTQLQTTSLAHPAVGHLSGNVADVGKRLLRWLGL
jgi:predicted Ser/Thr protein kinase